MIGVRTASGLKDIASVYVRTASGLKEVGEVWVRTASGLKQVFGALSAVASPAHVVGSTNSHGTIAVTTGYTTASVNPPGAATYSWSSPDPGWVALSPTSATTQFRYSGLAPGDTQSTTFTCTVTRGASTAFASVGAQVDNYGFA